MDWRKIRNWKGKLYLIFRELALKILKTSSMPFMKEKSKILIWILYLFSTFNSPRIFRELIVQFLTQPILGKINNNLMTLFIKLLKCSTKISKNIKTSLQTQLKQELQNYDIY
jgi:hypothetical protein